MFFKREESLVSAVVFVRGTTVRCAVFFADVLTEARATTRRVGVVVAFVAFVVVVGDFVARATTRRGADNCSVRTIAFMGLVVGDVGSAGLSVVRIWLFKYGYI